VAYASNNNNNSKFLPRVDPPVESSEGDTSSTCNTRLNGFKATTTAQAGQTAVSTTTAYNMTTLNASLQESVPEISNTGTKFPKSVAFEIAKP